MVLISKITKTEEKRKKAGNIELRLKFYPRRNTCKMNLDQARAADFEIAFDFWVKSWQVLFII
jgi:hypothetical protein